MSASQMVLQTAAVLGVVAIVCEGSLGCVSVVLASVDACEMQPAPRMARVDHGQKRDKRAGLGKCPNGKRCPREVLEGIGAENRRRTTPTQSHRRHELVSGGVRLREAGSARPTRARWA